MRRVAKAAGLRFTAGRAATRTSGAGGDFACARQHGAGVVSNMSGAGGRAVASHGECHRAAFRSIASLDNFTVKL